VTARSVPAQSSTAWRGAPDAIRAAILNCRGPPDLRLWRPVASWPCTSVRPWAESRRPLSLESRGHDFDRVLTVLCWEGCVFTPQLVGSIGRGGLSGDIHARRVS
jgi:hypothetical protein